MNTNGDEEELCYAWATELLDEDGVPWIDIMMNMMIFPFIEQMQAMPILTRVPLEVLLEEDK